MRKKYVFDQYLCPSSEKLCPEEWFNLTHTIRAIQTLPTARYCAKVHQDRLTISLKNAPLIFLCKSLNSLRLTDKTVSSISAKRQLPQPIYFIH